MSALIGETSYDTLASALASAVSGDEIILISDETITENITISSGIQVTIPTSAEYNDTVNGNGTTEYIEGSAYVTLTIPEGASVFIDGMFLVAGNQYCSASNAGKLTGSWGAVQLEGTITVSETGVLYALGEISGDGTIAADGTVYERLEINDFPGGTIAETLVEDTKVFPFSWWNPGGCESSIEFGSGGILYLTAYISISTNQVKASIELAGPDGYIQGSGIVQSGSSFTVNDEAVSRDLSISFASYKVQVSNFVIPVSIDIVINGTFEIANKTKIMPGATITINGTLIADNGIYLYSDSGYSSNYNIQKYHPGESAYMKFGSNGSFAGNVYSTDLYLYNVDNYCSSRDENRDRITESLYEYNYATEQYEEVAFILGAEGDSSSDYESQSGELVESESSTSGISGALIARESEYVAGDEIKPAIYKVIMDSSTPVDPRYVCVVSDGGYSFYYASAYLSAGKSYTIIVSVNPAESTVCFSLGHGNLTTRTEMEDALLAVGTADSNGLCSFTMTGTGNTLYAWIYIWSTDGTQSDYGIEITVLETSNYEYTGSTDNDEGENSSGTGDDESSSSENEEEKEESEEETEEKSGTGSYGNVSGTTADSSTSTGNTSSSTGGSSTDNAVTAEQEDENEAGILTIYTGTYWETVENTTGESGYVFYYFSGTAPGNAESVFLSNVDHIPSTDEYSTILDTLEFLSAGIILSTTPDDDGKYEIAIKDEYNYTGYLVVWCVCLSGSGGLTVSMYYTTGTCLSGDTLIAMASGPAKQLCEVQAGDMALSGSYEATRVIRVQKGTYSGTHTLYTFSDGTVIDETHPHRFYNQEQGFWQLLERWNIGDHARKRDGTSPALISRETREERTELFGIWTEDKTYWANGLLSGETDANEKLIRDCSIEKAVEIASSLSEPGIMKYFGE